MINKKAGLPDGFFLIAAFFAIALIFILMFVIVSKMNDEFQDSSVIDANAKALSSELVGKYANLFDKMFLFIVIGLMFAVLAGAWFINSHPALFWISVPILAFTIWIGALFANIYKEITANDKISSYVSSFGYTNFIWDNFVVVITVFVLMLGLALYAKRGQQQ